MGLMYNSLCVLTHPQWPWGSPQCITVNAELHSVVARGAFCTHMQELYLQNYKIYAQKQPILHKSHMHHSHYTQIHVHKHAPLHLHRTVAITQININAWPWMSLAVTGTLWYERDPIDPRPTSPSSSKGHHSITIDLLCVCVCVWGREMKGVSENEAQPAED